MIEAPAIPDQTEVEHIEPTKFYSKEFSNVETPEEQEMLIQFLNTVGAGDMQVALSVFYTRKDVTEEGEIDKRTAYRSAWDDEYALTIRVRLNERDASTVLKPFTDAFYLGQAQLSELERRTAIGEREVEVARLQKELDALRG